jgi:hypothetical protein
VRTTQAISGLAEESCLAACKKPEEVSMIPKRGSSSAPLVFLFSLSVGFLAGCDMGSGQIPLANVPPPPAGFGANNEKSKLPNGASPIDATERRK